MAAGCSVAIVGVAHRRRPPPAACRSSAAILTFSLLLSLSLPLSLLSRPRFRPPAEIPVGRTNDLLVALANSGSSMFNVSHIEGELMDAEGKTIVLSLGKTEYGQSLGPREQRSFRFPMPLDAEQKLGDYTLVARAFYNKRDKSPFVSAVVNDSVELVPPLDPAGHKDSLRKLRPKA